MRAIENHTAADGVIGIGEIGIQVGEHDVRSGADEVGVGTEGQTGFVEHAYHAGDACLLGDGVDFQGVVQAARLARFDVEQIASAHRRQPFGVDLIEQGFVGHDGDGAGGAHAGQRLEIPIGDRLLAEFDIAPG